MKPTLLVMAAGLGSRYGGVKQIDAVGRHGECLLDFAVYDAIRSGFDKVVFIIRKDIEKDFRDRIFDRIAEKTDASYVFQEKTSKLTDLEIRRSSNRLKPWGTVHCVLCAENEIKAPFAVINADDYYGRTAYLTMGDYLNAVDPGSVNHSMIGFELDKTMSENGSVSRGICSVSAEGKLLNMVENTKIEFTADHRIVSHLDSDDVFLTGTEPVSMNFFGFTPRIFNFLNEYWEDFKKTYIEEPKKESLLPNAAGELVRSGKGTISVLPNRERWFGMTYPEDKAEVMSNLGRMIDSGIYPDSLWD